MKTVLTLTTAALIGVILAGCDGGSGVSDADVKPPPTTPIDSPSKSRSLSQSDQTSGQAPPPSEPADEE